MCLVEDILAKDVKIVDGMAVAAIMVWRRGSRAFLAESGNVGVVIESCTVGIVVVSRRGEIQVDERVDVGKSGEIVPYTEPKVVVIEACRRAYDFGGLETGGRCERTDSVRRDAVFELWLEFVGNAVVGGRSHIDLLGDTVKDGVVVTNDVD